MKKIFIILLLFPFFCLCLTQEKNKWNDELIYSAFEPNIEVNNTSTNNLFIPNETNFTSMQNYFSSLYTNIGYNAFGSCGLVSIAMLLSYYDTFWDDRIIAENFDSCGFLQRATYKIELSESPGIFNEKDLLLNDVDAVLSVNEFYELDDYKRFIEFNKDNFFHLFLLKKALDNVKILTSSVDSYPFNFSLGMSANQIYFMLCQYIDDMNINISVDTNVSNNLSARDYAISMLQQNIPVLMGISKNNNEGHVVVAYKYDTSTDTIFFHSGLENYGSYATLEAMGYDSIQFSIALVEFENHFCSDNIVLAGESYCVCDMDSSYSSHSHIYMNYSKFDNVKHYAECPCGIRKKENHTISLSHIIISNGHRYSNCIYCGQLVEINIDGPIVGIKSNRKYF